MRIFADHLRSAHELEFERAVSEFPLTLLAVQNAGPSTSTELRSAPSSVQGKLGNRGWLPSVQHNVFNA